MLICPSFFDGRQDGIGRVSGACFGAMTRLAGCAPFVVSANDRPGACPPEVGRCFGGRYGRLLWESLFLTEREVGSTNRSRPTEAPMVCTHLALSPVARLASFGEGRRYVVFIHGVEAWRPLAWRSRWGLAGADCLWFNSNYTRRTFLEFNPWAADRPGLVVPLGLTLPTGPQGGEVEATPAPVAEAEHGGFGAAEPGAFRILAVGRMAHGEYCEGARDGTDLYKGFKALIEAVGLLARQVPGVRLWIAGDGDARPDLEKWLAARPEREWVTILGRVSEERLARLYRDADVFALPSEAEGFGLVFVEAMAHGRPCVCVRAGAAPEVVVDGESGLVASPRDGADLADKLQVLAQNPALRDRLGAGARRAQAERFTKAAFEDRLVAALQEEAFRA